MKTYGARMTACGAFSVTDCRRPRANSTARKRTASTDFSHAVRDGTPETTSVRKRPTVGSDNPARAARESACHPSNTMATSVPHATSSMRPIAALLRPTGSDFKSAADD
jgi:hypothetical protein